MDIMVPRTNNTISVEAYVHGEADQTTAGLPEHLFVDIQSLVDFVGLTEALKNDTKRNWTAIIDFFVKVYPLKTMTHHQGALLLGYFRQNPLIRLLNGRRERG